ncbi:MAG: nucleoside triphosphate pyrophosphohydrolase [Chloroflexi bacterium]|nr:nucleoside triphosphate pyrophosphohydrolase [Chloroflexota bacterium]
MNQSAGQEFSQLVDTLARLRAPDGCPWDREQTHDSLRRYLLEEAYEVLEAIDRGSPALLAEELGDVLLQVLFHAQIAAEAHQFTIASVVQSQREKLVRRHPHVFGGAKVKDAREVEARWEEMKRAERGDAGGTSALGRVPITTPALAYSQLIQDRASRSGFDWGNLEGVLDKVSEEVGEISTAPSQEAKVREFGDLLLVLVNVGRWLGIHAEDALRQANARFYGRFTEMERLAKERGLSFADLPLDEKERLWQEVKGREIA